MQNYIPVKNFRPDLPRPRKIITDLFQDHARSSQISAIILEDLPSLEISECPTFLRRLSHFFLGKFMEDLARSLEDLGGFRTDLKRSWQIIEDFFPNQARSSQNSEIILEDLPSLEIGERPHSLEDYPIFSRENPWKTWQNP